MNKKRINKFLKIKIYQYFEAWAIRCSNMHKVLLIHNVGTDKFSTINQR